MGLPAPGSKESIEFCEAWDKSRGKVAEKHKLCQRYGVSYGSAANYRMKCKVPPPEGKQSKSDEPEVKYVPYPKVEVMRFVPEGKRSEEDIGICLGDIHVGRKTESYSVEVCKKRLDRILNRVMRIIELHQPIKRAHVFLLGDMVQGEDARKGSNMETTECSAGDQIHVYAVPFLTRFFLSLAQLVEAVEVDTTPGNHGIYAKGSPRRTNWDLFLYHELRLALQHQSRINITPATKFYAMRDIRGFRFFAFHGDQVRASQGIPLFALKRRCQEWDAVFGPVHYFLCGHWHTKGSEQINHHAYLLMNPSLVTDDEWSLEVIGRSSPPVQTVFGIHGKHGVTWEYALTADEGYTPKDFGKEGR